MGLQMHAHDIAAGIVGGVVAVLFSRLLPSSRSPEVNENTYVRIFMIFAGVAAGVRLSWYFAWFR